MRSRNTVERAKRMQRQIQQIVARYLVSDAKDPDLKNVTITEVEMTGDLQNATIYWTALDLDGNDTRELAQAALSRISGRMRSELARNLETRLTPTVQFTHDDLGENLGSIENLLAKAQAADSAMRQARGGIDAVEETVKEEM
jgi:ribosome-binding factor A